MSKNAERKATQAAGPEAQKYKTFQGVDPRCAVAEILVGRRPPPPPPPSRKIYEFSIALKEG